jgi:hypothetical protein
VVLVGWRQVSAPNRDILAAWELHDNFAVAVDEVPVIVIDAHRRRRTSLAQTISF